jgi:drug/metabolite transporter (DMT)-like permease
MLIWLWVLVRIVANPFSNVFQKVLTRKAADPLFVICLPMLLLAAACIPIYPGADRVIRNGFWPAMLICAVLAVCGNVLIVRALKISDLSVLGPINAYKSVVSLVPGMILLHEVPRPIGIAGIGLILGGSYFLVDKQVNQPRRNLFIRFFADRGIRYRLAALVFSAVEAVFLKRALLASDALTTFAFWSLLGAGVSVMTVGLLSVRRVPGELRLAQQNWKPYLLLAATTGLMQLGTLITSSRCRSAPRWRCFRYQPC